MTPTEVDRVRNRWLDAQARRATRAEEVAALIVGTVLVLGGVTLIVLAFALAAFLLWVVCWLGGWA